MFSAEDCPLRVKSECLPQVKEFEYLGYLFISERTVVWEIGRRIGAAGVISHTLYSAVVTKRELSQRAKLLIYCLIFIPSLTLMRDGS